LCSLPLSWIESSEPLLVQAATLKATHALPVAAAWIAAAALSQGAVLVHKDPEFKSIQPLLAERLG
jgi:predicted nucleic acid-binding protein